jgi:hypothetical protein
MVFYFMISIGCVEMGLEVGKGICVFVYCNGQKCKKIKQSPVFGWICVAGGPIIRISKGRISFAGLVNTPLLSLDEWL